MSILSTTKTGKSSINITKEMIERRGYTKIFGKYKKKLSNTQIYIDFINYLDFDTGYSPVTEDIYVYLPLLSTVKGIQGRFVDHHPFKIYTIDDLNLVERYFNEKDTRKRGKYKKQLFNILKDRLSKEDNIINYYEILI
jgi:hypothetical protein